MVCYSVDVGKLPHMHTAGVTMETNYTARLADLLARSAETDRRAAEDLRALQAAGADLAAAADRLLREMRD